MSSKRNTLTGIAKERNLLGSYTSIVGIDEAGRGPWAGPVSIAGILLQDQNFHPIEGVYDSKKVSEKKREELFSAITAAHPYAVVLIDNNTIDAVGIGKAVIQGMQQVMDQLESQYYLIDGYFPNSSFTKLTECVIDGDAIHYCIAAASIIAKYTRDVTMVKYDAEYPQYAFRQHKGYGTKLHQELLAKYGPTPIHRKSFKPIRQIIATKVDTNG